MAVRNQPSHSARPARLVRHTALTALLPADCPLAARHWVRQVGVGVWEPHHYYPVHFRDHYCSPFTPNSPSPILHQITRRLSFSGPLDPHWNYMLSMHMRPARASLWGVGTFFRGQVANHALRANFKAGRQGTVGCPSHAWASGKRSVLAERRTTAQSGQSGL